MYANLQTTTSGVWKLTMKQTDKETAMSIHGVPTEFELTAREMDILRLLFTGQRSTEIANSLKISKRTIDKHLAHAYTKMRVINRYDAYRRAIELGIISE
jgi:DNA-binding CsgD family transcriptional regulator